MVLSSEMFLLHSHWIFIYCHSFLNIKQQIDSYNWWYRKSITVSTTPSNLHSQYITWIRYMYTINSMYMSVIGNRSNSLGLSNIAGASIANWTSHSNLSCTSASLVREKSQDVPCPVSRVPPIPGLLIKLRVYGSDVDKLLTGIGAFEFEKIGLG